jgi:hypothetical protein
MKQPLDQLADSTHATVCGVRAHSADLDAAMLRRLAEPKSGSSAPTGGG